jgi:hypothetical protein
MNKDKGVKEWWNLRKGAKSESPQKEISHKRLWNKNNYSNKEDPF